MPVNKKMTEEIAEILRDHYWVGTVCDGVVSYYTAEDAREAAERAVEDCWAVECFEEDWFPFVAVPALRETLDWERIAEVTNEELYEINVCYLFDD